MPQLVGRHRPHGRGQSLVEFALVLPLFLVLVMGIVDLGLSVFAYNSITNAAREGARLAIVNQDTTKVTSKAKSQATVARTPTVTVAYYQANTDGTPNLAETCPVTGSSYIGVGCLAVVTFTGVYQPITPLIGSILFKNGVTFTAKSVLPVEFSCPNSLLTSAQCPRQP
jgi:Flp pilus assembly protein TadG